MDCNKFQQQMDDLLDDQLSESVGIDANNHLSLCANCLKQFELAKSLQARLNSIAVPEQEPGLNKRIIGKFRQQQPKGIHWIPSSIGGAIAAMLIMWVTISHQTNESEGLSELNYIVINIEEMQERTVQLVFNAPEEYQSATFVIEMPENLELNGYPGNRLLSWKSSLRKGKNKLALPFVATGQVKGEVIARLEIGNQSKEFHMQIKHNFAANF
jgi:hypothetical protein